MAPIDDTGNDLPAKKIQDVVKTNSICLFATNLTSLPVQARPMNTQFADQNGSLWFFSNKDSVKNEAIRQDPRVHLFYVDPLKGQFVSIYGHAQILFDREKIEEFWSAIALNWFTGKDDPQISLIKVSPENIARWDSAQNKMALALPSAEEAQTKSKDILKDFPAIDQLPVSILKPN